MAFEGDELAVTVLGRRSAPVSSPACRGTFPIRGGTTSSIPRRHARTDRDRDPELRRVRVSRARRRRWRRRTAARRTPFAEATGTGSIATATSLRRNISSGAPRRSSDGGNAQTRAWWTREVRWDASSDPRVRRSSVFERRAARRFERTMRATRSSSKLSTDSSRRRARERRASRWPDGSNTRDTEGDVRANGLDVAAGAEVGPTPTEVGPTPTEVGPTPTEVGPTPTSKKPRRRNPRRARFPRAAANADDAIDAIDATRDVGVVGGFPNASRGSVAPDATFRAARPRRRPRDLRFRRRRRFRTTPSTISPTYSRGRRNRPQLPRPRRRKGRRMKGSKDVKGSALKDVKGSA